MPTKISKTFGVVVGSALIIGCLTGLLTYIWGITTGDVFAGLGALVIGVVIGYPIGAVVGIVVVKKLLHYQGSLSFGIIGLVVGGVISFFVFGYVVIGSSPIPDTIEWVLVLAITPLFGTLGYCLVKKSNGTTE